jgi:hypothetical protein
MLRNEVGRMTFWGTEIVARVDVVYIRYARNMVFQTSLYNVLYKYIQYRYHTPYEVLVLSQTLSFEFFDTICGILNRTTEQKMHQLVLLVALPKKPTTKSKITVTTSALPLQHLYWPITDKIDYRVRY